MDYGAEHHREMFLHETLELFDVAAVFALLLADQRSAQSPPPADCGFSGSLVEHRFQQRVTTVPDLRLLQELLGRSSVASHHQSQQELFALTFALRYRLTLLAILCHQIAAPDVFLDADLVVPGLDPNLLAKERGDLAAMVFSQEPELAKTGPGGGWLPLIGFNPKGAVLAWRQARQCRAFDSYEITNCSRLAVNGSVFCAEHRAEGAWFLQSHRSAPVLSSTQATMFAFYGDRRNFVAYGEEELAELVQNFWVHFLRHYRDPVVAMPQQQALARLNIDPKDFNVHWGSARLKKAYLRQAQRCHPDHGGDPEEFMGIRAAYLQLKAVLLSP